MSDMSFPLSEPALAAAATATPSNVRLNPFNEENIHQWFNSHDAEFANNRIVKSCDKFSLARVKLPKSITDIYSEELDACRDQADAYDALQSFIISQFGKSKWASYFELLRLPCIVENIKPSKMYAKL